MASQQSTIQESITGGVGTIGYRAPEQEASASKKNSKGTGSYNVQVDIYSFGIILFEMFHPPFETVRCYYFLSNSDLHSINPFPIIQRVVYGAFPYSSAATRGYNPN